MPELHVRPAPEDNALALASFIADLADGAVGARGRFTIALSGGSTPRRLYQILADPPYASRGRWDRWHVFWSDERCVPPDDPQSNYRMATEALLDRVPIPPSQVRRIRGEDPPDQAARRYEEQLAALFGHGTPSFDLVLLGLGDDGHTASLFPGSEALDERQRLVVAPWVPHLAAHRLTFSLPLINAARTVVFLVSDGSKADRVKQAIEERVEDPPVPAGLVAPVSGGLHWFLTTDAARQLSRVAP
ncbi:MAG: 6-phosphogluconolactonase [Dehalococcoidia bacterium]